MNDIEYLYNTDVREKKNIARSSRQRVCGSKTRYVSLPSDRLTPAQLRKRCGDTVTYNLSAPMTWSNYKKLPEDLKKEYITNPASKYEGTQKDIAEMLGISRTTMCRVAQNVLGSTNLFPASKKAKSPKWLEFIGSNAESEERCADTIEGVNDAPAPSSRVKQSDIKLDVCSGLLRYSGTPELVLQKALMAMDISAEYDITVSFFKRDADG